MKLAVLFSGGKDSVCSCWLAKKYGHEISCLLTIKSKNEDSFMFHTPAIDLTEKQAEAMGVPLIVSKTEGVKEDELLDLRNLISRAVKDYGIDGVVSGAVESVYQSKRVQEICNDLSLHCFNPLWQKDQFKVIISGVAGYPLDDSWIGRVLDEKFISDIKKINKKYFLSPTGEGGEFESFVLDCPLFNHPLSVENVEVIGEKNSWRGNFVLK
jgi:diphthine-ammonia ligase